jgi:pyruvate,orthophosphate dikinase
VRRAGLIMEKKLFYFFGDGKAEGAGTMKDVLGGKGAGLAEMTHIGIPVPAGFTIATDACNLYFEKKGKMPPAFEARMLQYVRRLEKSAGARFGDLKSPLLVSVRSGAKFSMPGMMDTILNLGLNDRTAEALGRRTGDRRFANDCYRRFIMMFGSVVEGIPRELFEEALHRRKAERRMKVDLELGETDMVYLSEIFKRIYAERVGRPFPQDPIEQLRQARDAVFRSWHNPRAKTYRRMNHIPDTLGTAVNVQAMVFGNLGDSCGTGVGFSRNPSTGEKILYGEFLQNAQGEDVVAGVRTPIPLARLKQDQPRTYAALESVARRLERHYRDVQDFEFTIQHGKLFMLQTRSGKRNGMAAVRIAVDLVKEKILTWKDALRIVEPQHLEQALHPSFDSRALAEAEVVARGLNASPGAAAGRVAFSPERAVELTEKGERVILVRAETSPDDIAGMAAARGFLTSTGGMTSHAAVVGRGMGKPAVVGCSEINVDEENKRFSAGESTYCEGDFISIDGSTGKVLHGDVPLADSEIIQVVRGNRRPEDSPNYRAFATFLSWADRVRALRVRANADTPEDARIAVAFGAEGIGLCRTEHMFFAPGRIPVVQEMILARDAAGRAGALERLLPMQREDFTGILRAMGERPVTIRLLDPPLHEFLPSAQSLEQEILQAEREGRKDVAESRRAVLRRVEELHELNPMLGHRGCRLGITMPDVTEMQVKAIYEAAGALRREGLKVQPEVMIPLVGNVNELAHQRAIVARVAAEVTAREGSSIPVKIGTMIEVPRACVTADRIAEQADFFSFGTNDLTQTTLGFSRDDAGKFLRPYLQMEILKHDPFVTLDTEGVGGLIQTAVTKGRAARKDLKVGICGEHGGDPHSIAYCHGAGLNYVSCSPFRVPVARLAAAQAALAGGVVSEASGSLRKPRRATAEARR